jgi:hypothetical protein
VGIASEVDRAEVAHARGGRQLARFEESSVTGVDPDIAEGAEPTDGAVKTGRLVHRKDKTIPAINSTASLGSAVLEEAAREEEADGAAGDKERLALWGLADEECTVPKRGRHGGRLPGGVSCPDEVSECQGEEEERQEGEYSAF